MGKEVSFEILLDPSDEHFVGLSDPSKCAVDLGDWWESNCLRGQDRPAIVIKLPEILGKKNPKISIRFWTNDWHAFVVEKSKNLVNWIRVWSKTGYSNIDKVYTIDLDPEYQYYRIWFKDGNFGWEKSRVYKHCTVTYVEEQTSPQPSQPTHPSKPTPELPQIPKEIYGIPTWMLVAGGIAVVVGMWMYYEEKKREELMLWSQS